MDWIDNSEEDQLDCNLSTLESANYLNKELLKQIDALKDENHSLREENDALRLQFEAITLNPTLRRYESEVDETSVFDDDYPESIVSSATKMNANQSVYSQSIGSDFVRYQQLQQQLKSLETDAENARSSNRELMTSYSKKLKLQSRKLGHMVDQVRPYFEQKKSYIDNKMKADELSIKYHQTIREMKNAQQMVLVFEAKLRDSPLDEEWCERLNEANDKVREAIESRDKLQVDHKRVTKIFQKSDRIMASYLLNQKSRIEKCQSYFELRDEFERKLDDNGKRLKGIEMELIDTKAALSSTLQNMGQREDIDSTVGSSLNQKGRSNESRSKPDGDDSISVVEESFQKDRVPRNSFQNTQWQYSLALTEINDEQNDQYEEDF